MRRFRRNGRRFASDALWRGAAMVAMVVCALTIFGGLALLALWSVAGLWSFPDTLPASFTLRTWARVQPTLSDPLWTTITVGYGLHGHRSHHRAGLPGTGSAHGAYRWGAGAVAALSTPAGAAGFLRVRAPTVLHRDRLGRDLGSVGARSSRLRTALRVPVPVRPVAGLRSPVRRYRHRAWCLAQPHVLAGATADAGEAGADGNGGGVCRIGRAISADPAGGRGAASDDHDEGGRIGIRRGQACAGGLCLPADGACRSSPS